MISKNSFSKKTLLLREGCRRHIWITILSLVGFLLSVILPVMIIVQRYQQSVKAGDLYYTFEEAGRDILSALSFFNPMSATILIILAVIGGIGVFCYLHSGKETDFFHSLPISREKLFLVDYLVVPMIVIPCYIVIVLLGVLIVSVMGFSSMMSMSLVLFGLLQSALFFLLIYSVAVLGTILCGNRVIASLLLLWIYFSLTSWIYIIVGYLSSLKTFVLPYWMDTVALKLSPILHFYELMSNESEIMYSANSSGALASTDWIPRIMASACDNLVGCLIAFIAISVVCYFLFKIRPSESAGNALAFEKSKTPIKIYMTVFMALVGGLFLASIVGEANNYLWMGIGIVIGGVIMHGVVEAIYAFDIRAIFRHLPHLGVSILVAFVVAFGIRLDAMGYDTKRVELSEIKSADLYCFNLQNNTVYRGYQPQSVDIFQDEENIEKVWQLANYCVDSLDQETDLNNESYLDCRITFHMKSGGTMQREYYVNSLEARTLAEELSHTPEYLQKYHELYRDDFLTHLDNPDNNIYLTIQSYYETDHNENLTDYVFDPEAIKEIWEAAGEDLMHADLDYLRTHLPELYLETDYSARIPIYPNYYQTMSLIQNYSDYQTFEIQTADVERVEITYYRDNEENESMVYNAVTYYDAPITVRVETSADFNGNRWKAEVTNAEDIRGLIQNVVPGMAVYSGEYPLNDSGDEVVLKVWLNDGTYVENLVYLEGNQPTELLAKYFAEAEPSPI